MNPHESPEITLNSWLLIFCIFFAAVACWLGSVGLWHQVGPAAGASGMVGLALLAVFCLVILCVVLTRAVDITGVLASGTLPLLATLAALSVLLS